MIRSLNLDGMFIPTPQPEIEFEMIRFNGGEMHIKLNNNINYSNVSKVVITNRIENGDDIMKILIAKDALQRKKIKSIDLIIPYMPYARQDRLCAEGESFTLKVFCDIINSANFDKVIIIDSHSDVAPALLNNCVNVSNIEYVKQCCQDIFKYKGYDGNGLLLVSPDSGANKKSNKLASDIGLFLDIVKCDKKRNVSDGSLSGFEVFYNDLQNMNCLIVDDICSKGGTFMGIAKALKAKNAGKIYLFTTHYEGVANESMLSASGICGVYKTNSMNDYQTDFVTNLKIQL